MTMMMGSGPFGHRPGGTFSFDRTGLDHVLYFEPSPRRVRTTFNGEVVADSRRMMLMHESRHLCVYYFPEGDVRMDLLEATDHATRCPVKGDASYWSVVVGERVAENAAWSYPRPIDGAPRIDGYVALVWEAMDAWFEEEAEISGHARDPYHRIDVLPTSRQIRIAVGGEVVAETARARVLFETGLPPRWYIPPDDVREDLLIPDDTTSQCPYKGTPDYRSLKLGDRVEKGLVWTYREPLREAADVAGLLCFYDERVDLEVDGELQGERQAA